jgi:Carboxypeptidase regulatory-like domain
MTLHDALPARGHLVTLLVVSAWLPAVTHAATLSITPASVAANYTGTIALDITGLASGQTVLVETFLDINGNGTIDAGDMLVQSFQVTDGQALSIGGVRNSNVPGDEDGLADGKIHTLLNFPALAAAKSVANFIYKVSPTTSGFTPVTAAFTITQPAYAQKVVGQVTSGGSAVPYAFISLLYPAGNSEPAAIALADANGNSTLNAAPGSYPVLAFKDGFVADFSAPSVVTVNTGATVTQNLSLTAADRSISGRVTDLYSGVGIPGVDISATSSSGLVGPFAFSDASGNFAIPVSSASTQWGVDPSWLSLALAGYLHLHHGGYPVDISGGSVSGVSIQLPTARALIYGTLKDDQGNPLAGVDVYADSSGPYEDYGPTDSAGNYLVGVTAGTWNINPDSDELTALGYSPTGTSVSVTDGQALRQDFTAQHLCVGDCNGNGQVTVDEILTMVNIALGNTPVTTCEAGDANHDGQITVDEILTAVNHALNGCSGAEQACVGSGGTVSTSLCCAGVGDFPNTCSIGACGCSPQASHEVQICNCGAGKCFGEASAGCVTR